MVILYSYWNRMPVTKIMYFYFTVVSTPRFFLFNPLKPELNPICYLLALLEAHHFLHISRIRVKSLTFR